jgi:hydroxyethylthiazole kinase-like uncharacterized protein yjeF
VISQPDHGTVRPVYVTTAAESATLDARTLASGAPGPELMRRAGETAVREMERTFGGRLGEGVCVVTGPGNNGGDGWMVAGLLVRRGVRTSVMEVVPPRSPDTQAARAQVVNDLHPTGEWTGEGIIVDALLGTGSSGDLRGEIAAAVDAIGAARARGAAVVALDVPTGVDATTGAAARAVQADLTVTFGTAKRGQLAARDLCGRIVVTDIGLLPPAAGDDWPTLLSAAEAYALVPPLTADAHKGSRGGVSIVGGGAGMAGAAILAGMGALRAGAGSSRICVADENTTAVHAAIPPALVTPWTRVLADAEKYLGRWPEAIAVGPGLGTDERAQQLLEQTLALWAGPLVLDADALNLLAGKLDDLRAALLKHGDAVRAILTPHPAEMRRLLSDGSRGSELSTRRYDVALEAARRAGAVVLFKGVPTLVAHPDGRRRVIASGTPALATGGSGDVLTGIIVTLLAQGVQPFDAAAAGAWFHGRAAELATSGGSSRGVTIEDVVASLRHVWEPPSSSTPEWLLAELPAIR